MDLQMSFVSKKQVQACLTYNEYQFERKILAAISFWLVSTNGELRLGNGNGGLRQGRLELVA